MSQKIISFHYKLTVADGKILDSSEGREPMTFLTEGEQIIPGLEKELLALKVGEKFRIGFCDYVPLKPAADTIVLVKGADDCPAVVAGKLGKGKAVLAGMAIGQDEKGAERMAPDDEKILVNSIYWLVEKQ